MRLDDEVEPEEEEQEEVFHPKKSSKSANFINIEFDTGDVSFSMYNFGLTFTNSQHCHFAIVAVSCGTQAKAATICTRKENRIEESFESRRR